MDSYVTTFDVAHHAGISEATVRRLLQDSGERMGSRGWRRWPASELPQLAALCREKQQRKRPNKFNSVPISAPRNLVEMGIVRKPLDSPSGSTLVR